MRVEVTPQREVGKQIGVTPRAAFGRDYYCRPEVNWPEACAAGRSFGPVAPDGHPKRMEWERHFLGQNCATVWVQSSEHMSLDPFIVIHDVNQNHPRNRQACLQAQFGRDPSWEFVGQYMQRGQLSWATAHGNGQVCASAKDGVGQQCITYEE